MAGLLFLSRLAEDLRRALFLPLLLKSGRVSSSTENGWMDEWVDGWMGGWMDGWEDGRMGGWVDGWMDTYIYH